MHRSGTTWLGTALGAMPSARLLDEPFHPVFGLRGVRDWYLDPESTHDLDLLEAGIGGLVEGRARFRRKVRPRHPLSTASVLIRGGGTERAFRAFHRSTDASASLVIKDPFLVRMTPRLLDLGTRTIVSVRHPAAILRSLDRMGWGPGPAATGDRIGDICAWWMRLYGPLLLRLNSATDAHLFVAHHETMFDDPDLLADALARFLGLTEPADIAGLRGFIARSTGSATVVPKGRRQHALDRNSAALATSWRADLDTRDLDRFESLIGPAYARLARAGERAIRSAGR